MFAHIKVFQFDRNYRNSPW